MPETPTGGSDENVEMVGSEDEDHDIRALILSGVPRNITMESRERSTVLEVTYRTPNGEDVKLGWDIEEAAVMDVYRRFNADLACILYRVLQCIGSYQGPLENLLRRPIKGEIELEISEIPVPVDREGYYDLDADLSGGRGTTMVKMEARELHREDGEVRNPYIRS